MCLFTQIFFYVVFFSRQFEKWSVGQLVGNHQLIDFDLIDV